MPERPKARPKVCVQVCALQWSRHEKEILSSHGFSQNQLCLWKYPSMVKVRHSHPYSHPAASRPHSVRSGPSAGLAFRVVF